MQPANARPYTLPPIRNTYWRTANPMVKKLSALLILSLGIQMASVEAIAQTDPFYGVYLEHCSTCHGASFEGAAQGPALASLVPMETGAQEDLVRVIQTGVAEKGMPAFGETLDETEIKRLAILISEVRMTGVKASDFFNVKEAFSIPEGPINTEKHTFRIESVATGLDPLPYSIAPLPDGRILVTEKMRGLRIVERDGSLSPR